jgi:type II secretory pathway component GspD/PulD (secretin)
MRAIMALLLAGVSLSAQVSPTIPVGDDKKEYRINTADYYSWNTRTETYSFKNVKASEFSHVLKGCISSYGKIQINDKLNMIIITDEKEKLKDVLALCAKLDTPDMSGFVKITSETVPVRYSRASAIVPVISNYLSVEGRIQSNDLLNFLVITDQPDVISRVKTEITKFDLPPKQVEFKVHIVEVYNNNQSDNGIDWGNLFSSFNANVSVSLSNDRQKQTSTNSLYDDVTSRSTRSSVQGSLVFGNFSNFLKFMVEKGAVKVVSDNSILALNNAHAAFNFQYRGKSFSVSIHPTALNDSSLILKTKITSNGTILLETSILSDIGNTNLLLRLESNESGTNVREVPLIGSALPFLFSRHSKTKNIKSVDIICTPVLMIHKK